jgi:hypothetical protein
MTHSNESEKHEADSLLSFEKQDKPKALPSKPEYTGGAVAPKLKPFGAQMRLIYGDMAGVFFFCWVPVFVAFFFPWDLLFGTGKVISDMTYSQLAMASLIAIFPWVVLILHLWRGRLLDGILDMLLWTVWECMIMLTLCYLYPDRAQDVLYHASDYWAEMKGWLVTGNGPEADPSIWLLNHLKHLLLLIATGFFGGLIALIFGVLQLNYMNFYVSEVLAASYDPLLTLAVAWHFYSILRVIGFIILASTFFQMFMALVMRRPSRYSSLTWGMIIGLSLVIADGVCKWLFASNVQMTLKSLTNL